MAKKFLLVNMHSLLSPEKRIGQLRVCVRLKIKPANNVHTERLQYFIKDIKGEWAWIKVGVPATFTQQFGDKQQGGFIDIVHPLIKKKILGWQKATLNLALRLEYVDWNVGKFTSTGGNIAEDLWSIMPAISFRPTAQTVLRLNYLHLRQQDLLGNPPAKTREFSFGISTYF